MNYYQFCQKYKQVRPANRGKWMLYVLSLKDGYFYIGSSQDAERRIQQHLNGDGAEFTKLHPPLQVVERRFLDVQFGKDATLEENKVVLQYALRYGADKVRGGAFCSDKSTEKIKQKLLELNDSLYDPDHLNPSKGGNKPSDDY